MPIFEFTCNNCGNDFEELLRSANAINEVECPTCHSPEVEKKVSLFASRIVGGVFSGGESLRSSCSTSAHST
jgi:putative FmdB family regulatory protein